MMYKSEKICKPPMLCGAGTPASCRREMNAEETVVFAAELGLSQRNTNGMSFATSADSHRDRKP
jgi:hypothetical protein